jgi:hypothetical protein
VICTCGGVSSGTVATVCNTEGEREVVWQQKGNSGKNEEDTTLGPLIFNWTRGRTLTEEGLIFLVHRVN